MAAAGAAAIAMPSDTTVATPVQVCAAAGAAAIAMPSDTKVATLQ